MEGLTQKGLNEEFVIDSNKQLTETYKHVVVSYGFEDFYSLYLFAKSNTQKEVMKYDSGTPKDYSSMSKVRRTIVRDGRRTAVTLYEKPKGVDNKHKVGGRRKGKTSPKAVTVSTPAQELNIIASGDIDSPIPTEDLQAVNKIVEGYVVVGDLEDLDRLKLYVDEQLEPRAVQGLRVDGEYLRMPFIATQEGVQSFYQRAFYEMVKLALNWELGIRMEIDETKMQRALAEASGMEEEDGEFKIEHEELLKQYGELP